MAIKQRVLRYKRATLLLGAAPDIQQLIASAVAKLGSVDKREQELVPGGNTRLVLTGVHTSQGMLVAKLMQYTEGQKQRFLEMDSTAGDYKFDSVSPPASSGAKREFVQSLMYVALFEGHVMYIGSSALRSKQLESHLNWLMHTSGVLAEDDFLFLADQQSEKALAELSTHKVDGLEIGGEIDFEVVERVPTVRKTKTSPGVPGHKIVKATGSIADAIDSLFGPIFSDAKLTSALNRQEHVGFKVVLNYRNRRKSDEGFDLMNRLAIAARHFEPDECKVLLNGGGVLRGDDIKVEKGLNVEVQLDGGLEEPFVWVKIYAWLQGAMASHVVGQE